jgi:hypothetical protein
MIWKFIKVAVSRCYCVYWTYMSLDQPGFLFPVACEQDYRHLPWTPFTCMGPWRFHFGQSIIHNSCLHEIAQTGLKSGPNWLSSDRDEFGARWM